MNGRLMVHVVHWLLHRTGHHLVACSACNGTGRDRATEAARGPYVLASRQPCTVCDGQAMKIEAV